MTNVSIRILNWILEIFDLKFIATTILDNIMKFNMPSKMNDPVKREHDSAAFPRVKLTSMNLRYFSFQRYCDTRINIFHRLSCRKRSMDWDNVKELSPERSAMATMMTTTKAFWRALNTTATKCFSTVFVLRYLFLLFSLGHGDGTLGLFHPGSSWRMK